MERIINFFTNITSIQIMDIIIAVAIIMFFRIFSSGMSYIIIRMFKFKAKNSKKIANFPSYGIMVISEWKHAVHVNDEWRELCSRYKEGFYEKK